MAKKHRINESYFHAANHLNNLVGYVIRNDGPRAYTTWTRLQKCIDSIYEELPAEKRGEGPANTANIVKITIAGTEYTACSNCREDMAVYQNTKSLEFPFLCSGCKKFDDRFAESTEWTIDENLKTISDSF